jgi:autotransporter translocation and assembly factor TamB
MLWRWARRLLTALLLLLGVVLVLAVETVQQLRVPGGGERLRYLALKVGRGFVPGLYVGAIHGDLLHGLTLERVVLNDRFGGEAIRVRRIAVGWDLLELPDVVHVTFVEIDEPRVTARTLESGQLNLAELVVPSPPEPEEPSEPSTMVVKLDRLAVTGAAFSMDPTVRVDRTDLRLALTMEPRDLQVQLRELATRVRLPAWPSPLEGRLGGRVRMRGEGIEADLELAATGVAPKGAPIKLALAVEGTLERLGLRLKVGLPGEGALRLRGKVAPPSATTPLDYDVALTLDGVQPQKVMAGLVPAVASLQLEAAGRGIPMQPGAKATLSLRERRGLQVQGIDVKQLRVKAELAGSAWKLEQLALQAAGARLSASGQGDLERFQGQLELHAPRLARTSKKVPVPLGLGGSLHLSARASGPYAGPLEVSCRARGAGLYAALPGQRVSLDGLHLDTALTGLPFKPRGRLKLRAAGIDPGVAAVGRFTALELDLRGHQHQLGLVLDVRGTQIDARTRLVASLDPARASARLSQLQLRWRRLKAALQGETTVSWQRAGGRVKLSPLTLRTLGGSLTASGELRQTGARRLRASLRLSQLRPPHRLIGVKEPLPRISGTVEASLERRGLLAAVALGLEGGTSVELSARLPVVLPRRGPGARPSWRHPGQLKLAVRRVDLARLSAFTGEKLGGRASIDVGLDGPLENPSVKLGVQLRKVRVRHLDRIDLDLDLAGDEQGIELDHTLAHAGQRLVGLRTRVGLGLRQLLRERAEIGRDPLAWLRSNKQAPVHVLLTAGPTRLESLWELAPQLRGMRGLASERIAIDGPLLAPKVVVRQRLKGGRLERRQLGDLVTSIEVTPRSGRTEAKVRVTHDGRAALKVDGLASFDLETLLGRRGLPDTPLHARVVIPPLDLARLKKVDPVLARARGRLQGEVQLDGTTRAPTASAELSLRRATFDGVTFGDLELEAGTRNEQLTGKLALTDPRGGRLRGAVRAPLKTPGRLEAELHGRRVDLGVISKLAPMVRQSAGKLDLDLTLDARKGIEEAAFKGRVRLKRGAFRVVGMPALERVELALDLDQRQVKLSRLSLRSGEGSLEAAASAGLERLKPTRMALDAKAEDLPVPMGSREPGAFSGAIRVRGGLEAGASAPRLKASVRIVDGVLVVPKLGGGRELHGVGAPDDVVYVDREAREKARQQGKPGEGPGLALEVAAVAKPLFVRGDELDLEVVTDVRAVVRPGGGPRLTGRIEISRGRIKVLGNPFKVRKARVLFSGQKEPDPALDVELARAFDDVTVLIGVRGTARSPDLVLTSEPPIYDRSQIISLILTGRVDQRDTGEDESDKSLAIANAVTQLLIGGTIRKVGSKVGLDVAKVNLGETKDAQTGEKSLRAEAELGKYITERLYVGYRPVYGAAADENAHEFLLEYRISLRWLLAAAFGDAGVGGLDLLWTYIY